MTVGRAAAGGEEGAKEAEGCQELTGDVFGFGKGVFGVNDEAKRFTVIGVISND